jgi:hypothetical protein
VQLRSRGCWAPGACLAGLTCGSSYRRQLNLDQGIMADQRSLWRVTHPLQVRRASQPMCRKGDLRNLDRLRFGDHKTRDESYGKQARKAEVPCGQHRPCGLFGSGRLLSHRRAPRAPSRMVAVVADPRLSAASFLHARQARRSWRPFGQATGQARRTPALTSMIGRLSQ